MPAHTHDSSVFSTQRLVTKTVVASLGHDSEFIRDVIGILTPNVTAALPPYFQGIDDAEKAESWVKKITEDGQTLAVYLTPENNLCGFIFLYQSDNDEVHLGYLLGETHQGKGLAKEILGGLLAWCKQNKQVRALIGGVEKNNVASSSLLLKLGFYRTESSSDDTDFYRFDIDSLAG